MAELTTDPDDDGRGWDTEGDKKAPPPQRGPHLSPQQQKDLDVMLDQLPDVFSTVPGHTRVVQHVIETPPGKEIRAPW